MADDRPHRATSTEARQPRKVREGIVVSNEDGQDRRGRGRRPGAAPPLPEDDAAHEAPLRARRDERRARGRPGARRRDASASRRTSVGGSWKSWSAPDDPTGIAAQGRRQLGCPRGALHQGARRYPPALREHRRRLRRDGEGRGSGCVGEEGRCRQVRRRAHEEGEAPSRRQLHPLRRERRSVDQRPACSREAPASSVRSGASCATSASCGSSRSRRRCCSHEDQKG